MFFSKDSEKLLLPIERKQAKSTEHLEVVSYIKASLHISSLIQICKTNVEKLASLINIIQQINFQWPNISDQFTLLQLRSFMICLTTEFAAILEIIAKKSSGSTVSIDSTAQLITQLNILLEKVRKFEIFSEHDKGSFPLARLFSQLAVIGNQTKSSECQCSIMFAELMMLINLCVDTKLIVMGEIGSILYSCGLLAESLHLSQVIEINNFFERNLFDLDLQAASEFLIGLGLLVKKFLIKSPFKIEFVNSILKKFKKSKSIDQASFKKMLYGLRTLAEYSAILNIDSINSTYLNIILSVLIKTKPSVNTSLEVLENMAVILNSLQSPLDCFSVELLSAILASLVDQIKSQATSISDVDFARYIGRALLVSGEILKNNPLFYRQIDSSDLLERVTDLLIQQLKCITSSGLKKGLISSTIYALRGLVLLGISVPTKPSQQLAAITLEYLKDRLEMINESSNNEYISLISQFALYLYITQEPGQQLPDFMQTFLTKHKPPQPKPDSLQFCVANILSKKNCTEVATEKEFGPYPVDIYAEFKTKNQSGAEQLVRVIGEIDGLYHLGKLGEAKDIFKTYVLLYKQAVDKVEHFNLLERHYNADEIVNILLQAKRTEEKTKAPQQLYQFINKKMGLEKKPSIVVLPTDCSDKKIEPPVYSVLPEFAISSIPKDLKLKTDYIQSISTIREDYSVWALLKFAAQGDSEAVKKILSRGMVSNPYSQCEDPYTLTIVLMHTLHIEQHVAQKERSKLWDMIRILVASSSIISLKEEKHGLSPLILAMKWKKNSPEVYEIIHKKLFSSKKNNRNMKKAKLVKKATNTMESILNRAQEQADKISDVELNPERLLKLQAQTQTQTKVVEKRLLEVKLEDKATDKKNSAQEAKKQELEAWGGVFRKHKLYSNRFDMKLILILRKAEQGSIVDQYLLGYKLSTGSGGVTKDLKAAEYWYQRASDQGYTPAQANLAQLYYQQGIHLERMLELCSKAAEQGDAIAQFNLANLYFLGKYVNKNLTRAVQLYKQCAKKGMLSAKINLAYCYQNELGVERDLNEALKLYSQAAEKGKAKAQYRMGDFYLHGIGIERNVLEAAKWYTLAAENKISDAEVELGILYRDGEFIGKNLDKAVNLLKRAFQDLNPNAAFELGSIYLEDLKNEKLGLHYFEKAAQLGHINAKFYLGELYFGEYNYIDQDQKKLEKAIKFYIEAADINHPLADFKLGVIYKKLGESKKSFEYFEKSAKLGNIDGQVALADFFLFGIGVEIDIKQAMIWYEKAAKNNQPRALFQMGYIYHHYMELINLDKAQIYYKKAAALNFESAEQKLIEIQDQIAKRKTKHSVNGDDLMAESIDQSKKTFTEHKQMTIQQLCEKFKVTDISSVGLAKCLRRAAAVNRPEELKNLLKLKINVDAQDVTSGKTALHWAYEKNSKECIQILLDNHANISIKDHSGKKPIDYSRQSSVSDKSRLSPI